MIKKVLFFFVLIGIILVLLEKSYDFLLANNYNIKTSYVQKKKLDADVVFLGSSNVLYLIEPSIFEKQTKLSIYNLAENHASLSENYLSLYLYLKNNKAPKYVFLGLALPDFTLSESRFHPYLFAPFMDEPEVWRVVGRENQDNSSWTKVPFAKYAIANEFVNTFALQGLWQLIKGKQKAFYPKGTYEVNEDPREFEGYEMFKKANPNGALIRWTNDDELRLKLLLNLCSERNIKLVIFEPPLFSESLKYFPDRMKNIHKVDSLARIYQSTYLTFDSLDWCKTKSNFVSAFHVNKRGKMLFTEDFSKWFTQGIK